MSEGNWGRWGPDDERGAANLLTAEAVRSAAGTVRAGEVVDLALPLDERTAVPSGRRPPQHVMRRDGGDYAAGAKLLGRSRFSEDVVTLDTHTGTHVDSLAHVWYDEQIYNGFGQESIRSSGARRCGVDKLGPLVGRGVLLDVAAEAGASVLPAGFAIGPERLAGACQAAGLEVRRGDIVLIRTGWLGAHRGDPDAYFDGEPGLDLAGAAWLAAHDVAAVGCDNYAVERLEAVSSDGFPVHELLLRDHGIPLMEGVVLDELARRGAREFLFAAAPLPLRGGTASPVTPIAIL